MQPTTKHKLDPAELQRLGRAMGAIAKARRGRQVDPAYAAPLPGELGVQLTYRCNLRCKTCFQWNDQGFFRHLDQDSARGEIAPEVFEKLLFQTREARSNLYLWGGEPLVHREWDALARMIEADPRWTVICTNALAIERQVESLLRISDNLVLLISIDGPRAENDAIRGRGTFDRIMHNIELISGLAQRGDYRGKLSLSLVLSDENVPKLMDFCAYCEQLPGIDTLYLVYPWYISPQVAATMDAYYARHLAWLGAPPAAGMASWHSYTHRVSPERIETLNTQVARIRARTWGIRIRFQPALGDHDVAGFCAGTEQPGQARSECMAVANRMDVLADGSVSACKLFPELTVGDLNTQDVAAIWHGERFRRVRGLVGEALMPICSKCVLLYLHGA